MKEPALPLYEYKCLECEEIFYELRSADEREHPIECPDCGGAGNVLISAFAPAKTLNSTSSSPGCPGGT